MSDDDAWRQNSSALPRTTDDMAHDGVIQRRLMRPAPLSLHQRLSRRPVRNSQLAFHDLARVRPRVLDGIEWYESAPAPSTTAWSAISSEDTLPRSVERVSLGHKPRGMTTPKDAPARAREIYEPTSALRRIESPRGPSIFFLTGDSPMEWSGEHLRGGGSGRTADTLLAPRARLDVSHLDIARC
jgi:hypothetical protein